MEAYYKQIPDGIKVPLEQAKVIFELIQVTYQSIIPNAEQVEVYNELCEILGVEYPVESPVEAVVPVEVVE